MWRRCDLGSLEWLDLVMYRLLALKLSDLLRSAELKNDIFVM